MALDDSGATPASSIEDTLRAKFAEAEERDGPRDAPPAPATPSITEPTQTEPAAPANLDTPRPGRTAGRPRDASGKLLPGKPVLAPQATDSPPAAAPSLEAPAVPAVPPSIKRPSSWKKDHWEAFDKIAVENPALAQYMVQREEEFSRGVSTYKREWDTAKPMLDAVAPYMPEIQRNGIDPARMVGNLMESHRTLATGDPQTKLGFVQKLLGDYGIPAQLAVQGQDGQWQLLAAAPQRPPQQQPPAQQDIAAIVEAKLAERDYARQLEAVKSDQEKYPHFEAVSETMAGLLQAGLADSYESAYAAALRHPRHADLFEAQQQQQRDQEEATRRQAEQARVTAAKTRSVSPASVTPAGPVAGNAGKLPKLEDSLREKFAAAGAGNGRL